MSKMQKVEEALASPTARLMRAKELNLCIISVMGYNTRIDPNLYKTCVQQTLLKHPRFSCILMEKEGKCWWKRTNVNIHDHVLHVLQDDEDLDGDGDGDGFVEDYASNQSRIPLDMRKPPWEIHILNVSTSDAKAVAIFKIHHSMGDGVSLMSLCHACSKKISDPETLPVIPKKLKLKDAGTGGWLWKFFWTMVLVVVNTLIDCTLFLATILFLKDRESPIKAMGGDVLPYKRFVHRIISLQDVKLIKTIMNVSINDVVLGVTQAGLSRYLMGRYGESSLPRNLRLRSAVVFNLRPTPTIEDLVEMMEKEELNGKWGNILGIVLLPFRIGVEKDPLIYIRRAKSNMDNKKLSLGHYFAFRTINALTFFFGTKCAARVARAVFRNTTLTFSNVSGPQEEVNLFGHHLAYISPSVYGFPQSLIVHYQSYADKLIISIGADEKLIPNPHQLCDDLVYSFQHVKQTLLLKTGLPDASTSIQILDKFV